MYTIIASGNNKIFRFDRESFGFLLCTVRPTGILEYNVYTPKNKRVSKKAHSEPGRVPVIIPTHDEYIQSKSGTITRVRKMNFERGAHNVAKSLGTVRKIFGYGGIAFMNVKRGLIYD